MDFPILDLHCDLLSYLATVPNASVHSTEDIGVAIPFLKAGNVKHQILAIYTPTETGSALLAEEQVKAYEKLISDETFVPVVTKEQAGKIYESDEIGVTVAIESASGLCEEDEPLAKAFERFDDIRSRCKHLLYISFTHHPENRFGGGNYSDNVGLKDDGKALLDYLDGQKIAVDFSHSSDNLVHGILDYITARGLDIPVMASHSNFRHLSNHVRNLPRELVAEIITREGLIGINFLRAYIHPTDHDQLFSHFLYGLRSPQVNPYLAFGADFFYRLAIQSPERIPLFFPEHEDATKYTFLLENLRDRGVSKAHLKSLAYENALRFIQRNW